MVHALERIRPWIDPEQGRLIDIHPVAIPRRLLVRVDSQTWQAGTLLDDDKFNTYRAADLALQEMVEHGSFTPIAERQFTFLVHLDTLDDLYTYLSERELIGEEWDYTVLDDTVGERVTQLLSTPGLDREIILHRPVYVRSYRPS